eukprot:TRINITY_DN55453_c0_g1_i1.p1 TRINITY_DN55453_c0_g1~~TRINITY_DN55453_c0_g1_i1.p1  ORF type:complete len:146 (-),score=29.91 TRINITY_DN55453_c0_g1_i1:19-456(-)
MSTEGLRAVLKKYRDQGRISSKLYSDFYGQAKGGCFKSEKAMLERLHKAMAEVQKTGAADPTAQARKQRGSLRRQEPASSGIDTEQLTEALDQLSIGQEVSVEYEGELYPATVSRCNEDGTFRVTYDIDNTYEDVDFARLEVRST